MGSFVDKIKSLKVLLPESYDNNIYEISWGDTLFNLKQEESFPLSKGFLNYAINATKILSQTYIECTMNYGSIITFCAVDSSQLTINQMNRATCLDVFYNEKFVDIINSGSFFQEQVFWAIHIGIRSIFEQRLWAVKSLHDSFHVHGVTEVPTAEFIKAIYPDKQNSEDFFALWNADDGDNFISLRQDCLRALKNCSRMYEGDEEWNISIQDDKVVINENGEKEACRSLGGYVTVTFYDQFVEHCNNLGVGVEERVKTLLLKDMVSLE